jgi:hypothetical protein
MTDFELGESSSQESHYPSEEDTAFTPGEQEAIRIYKENLTRKLNKNQSILKGLEMSFWGITSYSLARFLILTVGVEGIPLAISSILIINQITNREAIEDLINRKEGSSDIMGRIIKFAFSTVITAFLLWGSVGQFLSIIHSSKETYKQLQSVTQEFNRLPSDEQNAVYVVMGLLGLGGFYVLLDSRRR